MIAKYNGRCITCKNTFKAGDEVAYNRTASKVDGCPKCRAALATAISLSNFHAAMERNTIALTGPHTTGQRVWVKHPSGSVTLCKIVKGREGQPVTASDYIEAQHLRVTVEAVNPIWGQRWGTTCSIIDLAAA